MTCQDLIRHLLLCTLLSGEQRANRSHMSGQYIIILHPCFYFILFFLLQPSECISVTRQMSLNAKPGQPFQKSNVSSSVKSVSTQPDQLFSRLALFNLSDGNIRLTLWSQLTLVCQIWPIDDGNLMQNEVGRDTAGRKKSNNRLCKNILRTFGHHSITPSELNFREIILFS